MHRVLSITTVYATVYAAVYALFALLLFVSPSTVNSTCVPITTRSILLQHGVVVKVLGFHFLEMKTCTWDHLLYKMGTQFLWPRMAWDVTLVS